MINLKTKIRLRKRLGYAIIGGLLLAMLGILIPRTYYQFFDKREYVRYTDKIRFDKDLYAPCDTQYAITKIESLIDSPLKISSRLYLYTVSANEYKVVKEYHIDTFIKATKEQEIVSSQVLDCDLVEGEYFYRGVATYEVRGFSKTASFESVNFAVKSNVKTDPIRPIIIRPIENVIIIPTPIVPTITPIPTLTPIPTPTPKGKGKK